PQASPTATTTYYVTGTAGGFTCAAQDSIVVKVKSVNDFSISAAADSVCSKTGVQLNAVGGNVYTWSPANLFNDATINNPTAYPVNNTTFFVKIKDSVCNDSARLSIPIVTKPLPKLIITKSNDIDCYDLNAKLLVTGAGRYQWFTTEQPIYLTDSTIPNPIAFPSITRKYYVNGLDTISGCSTTDSIIVFTLLSGIPPFDAPNSFSPNNDGLNDCWRVYAKGRLKYFEMAIFNRWGNRVFFTTDVTKCWDGTYKGQPQDPGNFVYYIKASNECISNVSNGNLLLLR
ncbi:MAG: hypothetical protein RLY16_2165, partial [Bacteroidota bacterium]